MPIRSPRGRSTAYRSVWQWPLHSPLRLGISLAVVLALAIGVSALSSATRGSGGGSTAASGSASTTVAPGRTAQPGSSLAPTVLPPVAPLSPTELPLSQAPAAAMQTAADWSAAWVNHPPGITTQQWLDRLRPLTTDEYLGVLSGVDPGNVPATKVIGPPVALRVAAHSVQAQVPTDALTLLVLVVDTGSGWRVAGYDRA